MEPTPDAPVARYFRLGEAQKRALARLGILTTRDLLYHVPARYDQSGDTRSIAGIAHGSTVVLYGVLRKPEARLAWKSKRLMSEAWLEDGTGKVKLMWFNQPYIARMLADGALVRVSGRVEGAQSPYLANPEVEQVEALPTHDADTMFAQGNGAAEEKLIAVYPESVGITSRWFRHAVAKLLHAHVHEALDDPLPDAVRTRYKLPSLASALVWVHEPRHERDAEAARKRFAFEEIFVIQIAKQLSRRETDRAPCIGIPDGAAKARAFIATLPFTLTEGQEHAVAAILGDMAQPPAMSRLLEGDVGSGKTAVAAATAYAVVTTAPLGRPSAALQVAYMAPTEILAEQHFASFCDLFRHTGLSLGLMTGSGCKKFPSKTEPSKATAVSRAQLVRMAERGELAFLVGTHALLGDAVRFRDLAYVIIDEQHRFGTLQRQALVRKDGALPHLLSMTATPIPRTLALTLYGDLDLTVLGDMPPGRKRVITEVVERSGRAAMYTAVRRELDQGRQAYVICPRIEEPDPTKELAVQTKSVLAEAAHLRMHELGGYRIAALHGQMKPAEKDAAMRAFLAHETDVLVATSVVEVGVNVPNATVIVIEGAERFGLAQLHQLRGRVVRSTHQAYCFVLATEGGVSTRLKALARARNGFELAELDLKIRGPGELYGRSQSGLTDLGMEALKNLKMVEAARTEALRLVAEDPTLARFPTLATALAAQRERLHFE